MKFDYQKLFQDFLLEIRSQLNELEFKIWLSDLKFSSFNQGTLAIITTSDFKKEKIEQRYWELFKNCIQKYFQTNKIILLIEKIEVSSLKPIINQKLDEESSHQHSPPVKNQNLEDNHKLTSSGFETFSMKNVLVENTLENFVELPENKLAHSFINKALAKPGKINPIYIYGKVGTGKTHLLHGYANAFKKILPFNKIEYIHPDDFVSDFTRALNSKTDRNFRIHYRSLDALLIDDIQFFMGKEKSSAEFFHVFNSVYASGKQMIFTSDRDPRNLDNLDVRLKSRIASSAIIEIKPPNSASRLKLVESYLKKEKLEIPEEVKLFLGEHLPSDIRQLVGAIRYLAILQSINAQEITIPYCQQFLKQLSKTRKTKFHPEKILNGVTEYSQISLKDIKSRRKEKNISRYRQIAIYLLRKHTTLSFPEIGFSLGGRTVSSVIYGYDKIEKILSQNNDPKNTIFDDSLHLALKEDLEKILNLAEINAVF